MIFYTARIDKKDHTNNREWTTKLTFWIDANVTIISTGGGSFIQGPVPGKLPALRLECHVVEDRYVGTYRCETVPWTAGKSGELADEWSLDESLNLRWRSLHLITGVLLSNKPTNNLRYIVDAKESISE